ncbi:tetratricopeptide repeat protein [Nitrogeniibacter mangrovi]|uniref:Tetratricopeptide repeat protein n=1 Tax=Nitrogeniibacter mangrovi TaxID=2016596 RepID=A0A6C1AZX7_9RHOO|nr:tetratricopeptide repeat protein [Nitrogeniibacter mangrovi]QID16921.1 tetratricopeptide repeat protein [Nitrogeniibacter mangrovi]
MVVTRALWTAIGLLLAAIAPAHAGDGFAALWHNADQRAARQLQDGDAAGAAARFSNPRWRAFAQLKAGDYTAAAKGFAAFDDAEAHYNRGNALARAGDLKGALAAYDAALAKDPKETDARHNRDLVAKALKQQPPPPPSKSGSTHRHTDGKAGQNGNAGTPPPQAGTGQRGAHDTPNPATAPPRQAHDQGAARAKSPPSTPGKDAPAHDTADARTRAEADARHAVNAPQPPAAAQPNDRGAHAPAAAAPPRPPSERQLALEQWLRRIPEDPGGLLRRKFMIEYLMKHQGDSQ